MLLGAAAAWPLAAHAQQTGRLPTIGFLGQSTSANWTEWTAAFVQRLRELNWVAGQNLAIEYRWAEGRSQRFSAFAAEFVRLKVDVVVTGGSGALAAKQATSTIPIVFAVAVDPVGSGMVASLARPGGNVTGLSIQSSDLAGKRLELLREVFPGLRRVAIIANVAYSGAVLEIVRCRQRPASSASTSMCSKSGAPRISRPRLARSRAACRRSMCVPTRWSMPTTRINTLAVGARLPTIHAFRDFLAAEGFLSYGPNNAELFRRAGDYVDKILRGAKPADLPVEQPIKFELAINLTTAHALGLTIPQAVLQRADRVIQ